MANHESRCNHGSHSCGDSKKNGWQKLSTKELSGETIKLSFFQNSYFFSLGLACPSLFLLSLLLPEALLGCEPSFSEAPLLPANVQLGFFFQRMKEEFILSYSLSVFILILDTKCPLESKVDHLVACYTYRAPSLKP